MTGRLLIEQMPGETRVAKIAEGRLQAYQIERPQAISPGSLYLGRVMNLVKSLDAAFVDIGDARNAFLPLQEIPAGFELRVGALLPVQVAKAPVGEKGARLSGKISIAGRFLVYLPHQNCTAISSKISDASVRNELRAWSNSVKADDEGLLLRTAAETCEKEAMATELVELRNRWNRIQRRVLVSATPTRLDAGDDLISFALREMAGDDVKEVLVQGETAWQEAQELSVHTALAAKLRRYNGDKRLFALHSLDAEIDKLTDRRIWLKSGAYLIFDQVEAMTVIDVNSGKAPGDAPHKDAVLALNQEAAAEIARQLILRDVGGIVIVDFIDMDNEAHRRELVEKMRNLLRDDPAKTTLYGLTRLGMLEMTRKSLRGPLLEKLTEQCGVCRGSGRLRTSRTVAQTLIRSLYDEASASEGTATLLASCSKAVAEELIEIGAPKGLCVYVREHGSMNLERFSVQKILKGDLTADCRRLPVRADS